MTFAVTIYLTT